MKTIKNVQDIKDLMIKHGNNQRVYLPKTNEEITLDGLMFYFKLDELPIEYKLIDDKPLQSIDKHLIEALREQTRLLKDIIEMKDKQIKLRDDDIAMKNDVIKLQNEFIKNSGSNLCSIESMKILLSIADTFSTNDVISKDFEIYTRINEWFKKYFNSKGIGNT